MIEICYKYTKEFNSAIKKKGKVIEYSGETNGTEKFISNVVTKIHKSNMYTHSFTRLSYLQAPNVLC